MGAEPTAPSATITVESALGEAKKQLRQSGTESAGLDAELLLAFLLTQPRSWLFSHPADHLLPTQWSDYRQLIGRRCQGEPIAYLTGTREFWTLTLKTTPAVLVPRPESELLVELALEQLPAEEPALVVDLGTGSGAIALAVASERPQATIIATDRHADALAIARHNSQLSQLLIHPLIGHWSDALATACCDLIISNPPYIAENDHHLQHPTLNFEPRQALVAGPSGLDDLTEIATDAWRCLKPGGWLLMEHGAEQQPEMLALVSQLGYSTITDQLDYAGLPRVIMARKP